MTASSKYPVRWLTFQQRVRADLEETFRTAPEGTTIFTEAYLASLAAPIKQQEEWMLKLLFLQTTILGFLAVSFVSPDAKIGVFGFDLRAVDGLREILLALSATIALAIFCLVSTRDTAILILNVICEQTQQKSFLPYAKYVLPSAFSLRFYLPREYDRWFFSILPRRAFAMVIAVLLVVMFGIAFVASIAIHWSLIKDIWHHPGLGKWSIAALVYVFTCYLVNICVALNRWLPFPYKDQSFLRNSQPSKSVSFTRGGGVEKTG
jgi:hypothetical protein